VSIACGAKEPSVSLNISTTISARGMLDASTANHPDAGSSHSREMRRLVRAESSHVLLVDGMQKPPVAGDRDGASARHVEGAARLQGAPGKLCLEISGGELPI